MAKNGYKIFDSDTHVGPYMEVLDKYLSASERTRLAGWEQYKTINKRGQQTYTRGQRVYRRRLGDAKADEAPAGACRHAPHRHQDAVRGLPVLVLHQALEHAGGLDDQDEVGIGLELQVLDRDRD